LNDVPKRPQKKRKSKKPRKRRRLWLRILGWVSLAIFIVIGALVVESWTAMGKPPSTEHQTQLADSPRFGDGTFHNQLKEQTRYAGALWAMVRGDDNREPEEQIVVVPRRGSDFDVPPTGGLRVTWLGHSTSLIEIDGQRILFDPVWGQRSGPSQYVGPKRFFQPPLPLDELPPVDAVVISHDHYDHLDYPTIKALKDRKTRFIVPLGVGSHLQYWGVPKERIEELDWWQEVKSGDVRLVCTPSRHFSGRSLTDRNATLWASWALVGPKHRVYFSGDTAMFPEFTDIGERLGPFDIAMVESGAYNAAWADVHLGPEQAVQAALMVKAKLMLPVHWGTFNLAAHGWTEPVERVLAEAKRFDLPVVVPRPGESIVPAEKPELVRWWPTLPFKSASEAPIISSGLPATPTIPPAVTPSS
jgi:L-ascorbate metabolism protein UlaG (beta-lactamase superfamily)